MIESYESLSDERGPAKSYETILKLASGFDLSSIAFLKILEGKVNEEGEESGLNEEISNNLKKLSSKSVGHLLFILESNSAKEVLEIAKQSL